MKPKWKHTSTQWHWSDWRLGDIKLDTWIDDDGFERGVWWFAVGPLRLQFKLRYEGE